MAFNFAQPYGGGYNYNPMQNQTAYAPQPQPPSTNKLYVVSVEDALSRYAMPNTIIMYTLQDESAIIEVATDQQGRKSHRVRVLSDAPAPTENQSGDYISRAEFEAFRAEVQKFFPAEGGVTNG